MNDERKVTPGPVYVDENGGVWRSTRELLFAPTSLSPVPSMTGKSFLHPDQEADMAWRVPLWDAINNYAIACGGDPSNHVYGNTSRMKAVADVENTVRAALKGASNG